MDSNKSGSRATDDDLERDDHRIDDDQQWHPDDENEEYDWESVDWNEPIADEDEYDSESVDWSAPAAYARGSVAKQERVAPRNPDQLKVLATTSLVILAFISMLGAFYVIPLYFFVFLSDSPWVEGWMIFVSVLISVALSWFTWTFVKNSIDKP